MTPGEAGRCRCCFPPPPFFDGWLTTRGFGEDEKAAFSSTATPSADPPWDPLPPPPPLNGVKGLSLP